MSLADQLDSGEIVKKVERFLKYKIALLKVDGNSIVYVNVKTSEEPNLIRIPENRFLGSFKDFEKVRDDWYSKDD